MRRGAARERVGTIDSVATEPSVIRPAARRGSIHEVMAQPLFQALQSPDPLPRWVLQQAHRLSAAGNWLIGCSGGLFEAVQEVLSPLWWNRFHGIVRISRRRSRTAVVESELRSMGN
jgi:hypothetical protein